MKRNVTTRYVLFHIWIPLSFSIPLSFLPVSLSSYLFHSPSGQEEETETLIRWEEEWKFILSVFSKNTCRNTLVNAPIFHCKTATPNKWEKNEDEGEGEKMREKWEKNEGERVEEQWEGERMCKLIKWMDEGKEESLEWKSHSSISLSPSLAIRGKRYGSRGKRCVCSLDNRLLFLSFLREEEWE